MGISVINYAGLDVIENGGYSIEHKIILYY
jgi:hypothetical protein